MFPQEDLMSGNYHCLYDYFHIQMIFKYLPNYLIVMDEIMLSFYFYFLF